MQCRAELRPTAIGPITAAQGSTLSLCANPESVTPLLGLRVDADARREHERRKVDFVAHRHEPPLLIRVVIGVVVCHERRNLCDADALSVRSCRTSILCAFNGQRIRRYGGDFHLLVLDLDDIASGEPIVAGAVDESRVGDGGIRRADAAAVCDVCCAGVRLDAVVRQLIDHHIIRVCRCRAPLLCAGAPGEDRLAVALIIDAIIRDVLVLDLNHTGGWPRLTALHRVERDCRVLVCNAVVVIDARLFFVGVDTVLNDEICPLSDVSEDVVDAVCRAVMTP